MRRAFTAVEILTVLAIVAVLAGLSVPFWRTMMFRSDLHLAAEQTEQLLRRARILAQSGNPGDWGVYVPSGVLYQGTSYPTRNTEFDEALPLPSSVSATGVQDVSFSALYAEPSTQGDIILEAGNGEQIVIPIRRNTLDEPSSPAAPEATVEFNFERVQNWGKGNAQPSVHIGGNVYDDGEWIALTAGGDRLTDASISYGEPGIAVQRTDDYIEVLTYGNLPDKGSKELIDVRIRLRNATITDVQNVPGENETEGPFDGKINDGVGGDEVTQEGTDTVFFQTRVTNAGDSIRVYWEPKESRRYW